MVLSNKIRLIKNRSLVEKKFYTMLLGGVLSSIVASLVLISDTIVAGFFIGDKAVTGIGLVTPIYSLAASLGIVIALGAPILYSKSIGDFNQEEANRVFGLSLIASLALGMILFLLVVFAGEGYLESYKTSSEILLMARDYLRWMRFVILLFPISYFLPGMVFADGDETLSFLANVVGSVSNLLLSILLAPRLGVSGISIGSLCGTLISLTICSFHFFKKRNNLRPSIYFSWHMLLSIVRLSVVDAVSLFTLSVFVEVMNHYVSFHFGSDMIIMVSVITLTTETAFLLDGIGNAMTPILSIFFSENCYCGVEKMWKLAKKSALFMGIIIAVIMFLTAPLIPGLLGINDSTAIVIAVMGIRIVALGMPFISLLYLLTSYYILRDKVRLSLSITVCYQLLLLLPLTIFSSKIWGLNGLFIGSAATLAITWFGVQILIRLRFGNDAWPLLLVEEMRNIKSWSYELTVRPEEIIGTISEIEETLGKLEIDSKVIRHIALLIEEIFMDIHDRNNGKAVNGECDIIMKKDMFQMIEMDDGVLFNISYDIDEPRSWREYVLSQLSSVWLESSGYIKAVSFNRNVFVISRYRPGT